jgi:2-phosphosulfolactate phosphatase
MSLALEVLCSPAEITDLDLRDQNVVVIDVLRATTVIVRALSAGAKGIIPAETVEHALELRARIDPEALLCGERGGHRVPGFHLGNSPLEYTPEAIGGRTLILASTNGSVLLSRCVAARRAIVAALTNVGAVARLLQAAQGSWRILLAGKRGRACIEDLVCAGRLAGLLDRKTTVECVSDDASDGLAIALAIERSAPADLGTFLGSTAHGCYLESIGYASDLQACASVDTVPLVPEMIGGRIVPATVGEGAGPAEMGQPADRGRAANDRVRPAPGGTPGPSTARRAQTTALKSPRRPKLPGS